VQKIGGALHAIYLMETDTSLTLLEAFDKASKGYQVGHDKPQINPPILPPCTYVGLASKYCLKKYPEGAGECYLPTRCVY
jgi:hypothetical protein